MAISKFSLTIIRLILLGLFMLGSATMAQITNGEFEGPDPCGGTQPSAAGWSNASDNGGDQPEAESPGAGGSTGRIRIGDDVATPGVAGPEPSIILQSFRCDVEEANPDWFCNISFQSAYTNRDPFEMAYVSVSSAQGGVAETRAIPVSAVFGERRLHIEGCYPDMVIVLGVVSTNAGDTEINSSLYVDKIECDCDSLPNQENMPDPSQPPPPTDPSTAVPFEAPADDTDEDGVNDCEDNCPEIYNPDQSDVDGDGVGDVCERSADVPTMTEYGLAVLLLLLLITGAGILYRRRRLT